MTPFAVFYMHHMGAGWWLLTTLVALALWGLATWTALTLVRKRRAADSEPIEPPAAILGRRLAAGEISVEEYEARRQALAGVSP